MTREVLQWEMPAWYLFATPYYYNSAWWKHRAETFLEQHGHHCDACSVSVIGEKLVETTIKTRTKETEDWDTYTEGTDGRMYYFKVTTSRSWEDVEPTWCIHHVDYRFIGRERDQDLRVLCEMCHNVLHYLERDDSYRGLTGIAAEFWLRRNPDLQDILTSMFPVYPDGTRWNQEPTQPGEIVYPG